MGFLEPGSRWGYVIAAYVVTVVIMAALVWLSVAASRRARRELESLESGPRRAPASRPRS
jgi:heme exporter protein CcmD